MTLQQIKTDQIDGYSAGGGWEKFSATTSGTSLSITATGTIRSGVIALANTTDSLYISTSFTFGDLATGTARVCYGHLFPESGTGSRYLKIERNTAGTGLTVSMWGESFRDLLNTVSGLIVPTASVLSLAGLKYVADLRVG